MNKKTISGILACVLVLTMLASAFTPAPSAASESKTEAINEAQSLAVEYSNMQIEQEHLLYVLLNQPESFIIQLMVSMNLSGRVQRLSLP